MKTPLDSEDITFNIQVSTINRTTSSDVQSDIQDSYDVNFTDTNRFHSHAISSPNSAIGINIEIRPFGIDLPIPDIYLTGQNGQNRYNIEMPEFFSSKYIFEDKVTIDTKILEQVNSNLIYTVTVNNILTTNNSKAAPIDTVSTINNTEFGTPALANTFELHKIFRNSTIVTTESQTIKNTYIEFNFTDFNFTSTTGCQSDFVRLVPKDYPIEKRLCNDFFGVGEPNITLKQVFDTDYLNIEFASAPSFVAGLTSWRGEFQIKNISFHSASPNATITGTHADNHSEVHKIVRTDPSKVIKIKFTEFNVQAATSGVCLNDYIALRTSNGYISERYCNNSNTLHEIGNLAETPKEFNELFFDADWVNIEFGTDSTIGGIGIGGIEFNGFQVEFSEVDRSSL